MKRRSASSPISLFSFQDIITGLCGLLILFVLIMVIDLVIRRDGPPPPPEPDRPMAEIQTEIADLRETLDNMRRQVEEMRRKLSVALSREKADEARKDLSEKDRELSNLLAETKELETRLGKALDAKAKSAEKLKEMELARRNLEDSLDRLRKRNGITLIPERGYAKSPVFVVLGRGEVTVTAPLDASPRRNTFPENRLGEGLLQALSGFRPTTHSVVLIVRPSGVNAMDRAVELVKELGFSFGRDPLEEDKEISFGDGTEAAE